MTTTADLTEARIFPSTEADLFPFVVVRVAGGAFEDLAALDLVRASACLQTLRAAQDAVQRAAAEVRDEIYGAIGGCDDAELRRLLLGARRSLFNARPLDAGTIAALAAGCGPRLPHLGSYAGALLELDQQERRFRAAFQAELDDARRGLTALAGRDELQRPLALSSEVFLERVRRYAARRAGPPTAKELDVERTLMKYLARMHVKTSPFSTFCHVGAARIGETARLPIAGCDVDRPVSMVRINNLNWLALRTLILAVPEIAAHVPVRANPTLTFTAGEAKFLMNVRNVESFQSLPALEGLEQIVALAADRPARAVLVDRIVAAELVADEPGEARAFVDALVDHGLLEPDLRVSAADPDWDRAVVDLLSPLAASCEAAASVVEFLQALRADAGEFAGSDPLQRVAILRRAHERLERTRAALAEAAGVDAAPQPRQKLDEDTVFTVTGFDHGVSVAMQAMLYEDSLIGQPLLVDARLIGEVAASLSHAMTALTFTDGLEWERGQLRQYFLAHYAPGAAIPLLRFYEDYAREPSREREMSGEQARAFGAWTAALASRAVIEDDRIYIERADLEAAFDAAPEFWPSRPSQASGAFVQLARDRRDGVVAVLNATGPGYGKAINRFLHLFPPEVTQCQRAENLRAARGSRLAEINDAARSNANLHPPLLDWEIDSPGAQTSLPAEGRLPVSDLAVEADERGEVRLTHLPSGQRVEVLDLGLQGLMGRSRMFRLLLNGFGRSRHINWMPFAQVAAMVWRARHGVAEGIAFQPRIVYDRRIVLRRCSWCVPKALFPSRRPSENDEDYFARLNGWREEHGIPPHVFVILMRERRPGVAPDSKLGRDDYKPQFVSFLNWFSVALFEKMMARAGDEMILEEMLPLPDDMVVHDGRHHATELVMQWTLREW